MPANGGCQRDSKNYCHFLLREALGCAIITSDRIPQCFRSTKSHGGHWWAGRWVGRRFAQFERLPRDPYGGATS
jgi:hypothetical protein